MYRFENADPKKQAKDYWKHRFQFEDERKHQATPLINTEAEMWEQMAQRRAELEAEEQAYQIDQTI